MSQAKPRLSLRAKEMQQIYFGHVGQSVFGCAADIGPEVRVLLNAAVSQTSVGAAFSYRKKRMGNKTLTDFSFFVV